jgi:hypothetical protein
VVGAADAAPPGIRVVAVGRAAPNLAGAPANVEALADPDDLIRTRHAPGTEPTAGAATGILMNRAGAAERLAGPVDSVDDLLPPMSRLVG